MALARRDSGAQAVANPGFRLSYIGLVPDSADSDEPVLLCDPLTTLVAYPSFEEHLTHRLPELAADELHLAIGDVDGLREYVTERRSADPSSFGHLAGNDCMRRVGAITSAWACGELADGWRFHICSTFGGDEVIVAASGMTHDWFLDAIGRLCEQIRASAPRPCSFAVGTLASRELTGDQAPAVYRQLVSQVDACLFDVKEKWRAEGEHLNGRVFDAGHVSINACLRNEVRP